jgi:hypothetical protein
MKDGQYNHTVGLCQEIYGVGEPTDADTVNVA